MIRLAITVLGTAALVACSDGQATQNADNGTEAGDTAENGEEALTLTAEGYGPLRIGMTLDEVNDAMGPDADPEAIGGPEPEMCDQFRPDRAPEGLLVMMEQGVLTRISLTEPGVTTDTGLGVGDSAEAVREAYGESVHVSPHTYLDAPAEYLTVWSTGQQTGPYMQDENARGIRYETDENGNIQVIHAGGPSIQYVEGCL